ncbi:MAG: biopolymer transporter ExbD, partial [Myxococcales bacterium]|nr:biopolymer transporter ExbD [Myxococcales bacterium]
MVTTTFVKDAQVELERPSAASAKPASTKAIRVTLDRRGEVYVDGRPVRPWLLQGTVREQLRAANDRPVLVITDAVVPARKLIEVIDECRLAGAKDVAVATEREAG